MTFDGPESFDDASPFGNLDDPNPPALGADALSGVVARGQQIRRRRRTMYAGGSAAVVVVIAGAAIAVAAGGGAGNQKGPTALDTATAHPTHSVTSKPHKHPPASTQP